ncbi:MAG: hypothetical protein LBK71_01485, partial [Verrucomicrobiales bacterium]|nr:hypothetical protein [Verrucomicrobiales bacterium]
MKTPITKTLILTLCALSVSALNVLAQNLVVTSNTTVSDTHYENSGTNYAALTNSSTWTVTGSAVTLTGTAATGNGRYGARIARGTLNLFSSTVSANYRAIYLDNNSTANLTDSHVSTTGSLNDSTAIAFGSGTSRLFMNGGSIEASGSSGRGIMFFVYQPGIAVLRDVAIITHGYAGAGVYGQYHSGGSFTMIGGSITTYGDSARAVHCMGSNSIYTLQNVAIHTSGVNSQGITAMFGNFQFSGGSITTEGDGSHGIWFNGGPMNGTFDGITITTTGSGADGVRMVASATLALTNSELRTAGEDSSAFTVNDLSALTLNNTAVTVESAAPLLQVSGTGDGATVTVNGGTLTGAGGGDLLHFTGTAAGTGSVTFNQADTAAAGGIIALGDTVSDNIVNVNGGTGLRGDLTNSGSGSLTVNLNDSTLTGDVINAGDGSLVIALNNHSTGTGAFTGGDLNIVDGDSHWTFGQDSTLGHLGNHGTLNIGDHQITVSNADHTGTLNLNVNSDSGQGGSITVTGTAS